MTMNQLRNAAGDCKTTNRWATIGSSTVRIISLGRSKVRLLLANGTVKTVEPADIQAAW